jgi:hypothetical protein
MIKRIAFIRFLFLQGLTLSKLPEPLSAASVLSFHDAVELFLVAAADQAGVNCKTDTKFLEYWERIKSSGKDLPSKNAMDRLNRTRVGLKHYGRMPSRIEIEQLRADVTTFLGDATTLVFDVDLSRVDMADLVESARVSERLRHADAYAQSGEYFKAMAGLSLALKEILSTYGTQRIPTGPNPFAFGPNLPTMTLHQQDDNELLYNLTYATRELQTALRIQAMGIDYREYAAFRLIVPDPVRDMNGEIRYLTTEAQEAVTSDDYAACRNFVIKAYLEAARVEDFLETASRHQAINMPRPGSGRTPRFHTWSDPA